MQALRQRAACAASKTRPSASLLPSATRTYASGHGPDAHHDAHHDDHHHAPEVNEGLGSGLYYGLGAIGASLLLYNVSRPGENGELSAVHRWIEQFQSTNHQAKWVERNTLRTDIFEQAAADKTLFRTVPKRDFQYRTPELIHAGPVDNVPAGHTVNLDHVVEHYRKKHLDEEERKAKKMAAAKEK